MTSRWARLWLVWLAVVAASFVALEMTAICDAGWTTTYTLSDTIRRWSDAYRWLAPLSIGAAAFLMAHFFLEKNK